jgi:hypothetical protein
MPALSRWFIKAGFVALAIALAQELLLVRPPGSLPRLPDTALHLGALHLLTVGWLLQVIAGVAFWMFPRHPTAPPRGDARPGWTALALLNAGLLLRLVAEPWHYAIGGALWPLRLSALLQLVAVSLIAGMLWPRIRELKP